MKQLTLEDIVSRIEAGKLVAADFAEAMTASNFRNAVLTKIYRQRAQMRKVFDATYGTVSTSIALAEDGMSWRVSFKLTQQEKPRYNCIVISDDGSEEAEAEAEAGEAANG